MLESGEERLQPPQVWPLTSFLSPLSCHRPFVARVRSDRLERAVLTIRQFDAGARPALNELPCIALEIDGRGALARGARTGRTIVLALQGDAKALLLLGGDRRGDLRLRQRSGGGNRRERSRNGAGENERTDGIFYGHCFSFRRWHRRLGEDALFHSPRSRPALHCDRSGL